jgi:integrase
MVGAKRRELGLGAYPAVTLQMAHQVARDKLAQIKSGTDPVEAAQAARSAIKASQAKAFTFKVCALAYIDAHESGWRNSKHAQQWRNTLATYAYPVIGNMLVRDVDLPHILEVLQPIWHTKTETASRLRGRIESVIDWATTHKYREGMNPARWKGHLDNLLPAPRKVANAGHHAALPYNEAPAFMARLRTAAGMGARALEFAILTAARSGEVRGATWAEIDKEAAVWTIPANRMKGGIEHRVPLSPAALAVLRRLPRFAGTDLVFVSPRGGQLSDMALTAVTRRLDVPAVPHGFRSTFRDWASETTNYTERVAEAALAHAIGNRTVAAYLRGDVLDKRRPMMNDWARYLGKQISGRKAA